MAAGTTNEAGEAAGEKATFKAGAVYDTLKRRILDGIYTRNWLRLSQRVRDFSLSERPSVTLDQRRTGSRMIE